MWQLWKRENHLFVTLNFYNVLFVQGIKKIQTKSSDGAGNDRYRYDGIPFNK